MNTLPLHNQFDIIKLKLHLHKYPEQAKTIAIQQFTYHLEMLAENEKLEAENKKLKSVSLPPTDLEFNSRSQAGAHSAPPFGTPSHGQLQKQYDELLECYSELLTKLRNLAEENKALYKLLTEENPELPISVRRGRRT